MLPVRIGVITHSIEFFLLPTSMPYAIISSNHIGLYRLNINFRTRKITQCGRREVGGRKTIVIPKADPQHTSPINDFYQVVDRVDEDRGPTVTLPKYTFKKPISNQKEDICRFFKEVIHNPEFKN